MTRLGTDITDATLLCERCGYVLEGLDERGACPECGQPIAESHPSRRTGTPFQLYGDARQFLRHTALLFRAPRTLFGRMSIGREAADDAMLTRSCMGTALLLVLSLETVVSITVGSLHAAAIALPIMFGCWVVFWLGLVFLTWIERIGVVYFSRKRGWRVSKEVARAICTNASPAWLATGALTGVGSAFSLLLLRVSDGISEPWFTLLRGAVVIAPVFGFIAGMLVFETLVYIGVRRCKYANWMERDAPAQHDRP